MLRKNFPRFASVWAELFNWTREFNQLCVLETSITTFSAEHDLSAFDYGNVNSCFVNLISQKSLMMSSQKEGTVKRNKNIFFRRKYKKNNEQQLKRKTFVTAFIYSPMTEKYSSILLLFFRYPSHWLALVVRNFYRPEGQSVVTSFDFKAGNEKDWKFHLLYAAGNCIK